MTTPQLYDVPGDPITTNGAVIGWKWERGLLKVELGECAGVWEAFVFVETRADWIFTARGAAWQFVIPTIDRFLGQICEAIFALKHPLAHAIRRGDE